MFPQVKCQTVWWSAKSLSESHIEATSEDLPFRFDMMGSVVGEKAFQFRTSSTSASH